MPSRVLLDTSVLRAGFVSDAGASRLLLTAAFTGRITAIASTALMLEYEDVLLRPEILEQADVSARDVLAFLDGFCAVCQPVAVRIRWRPQSPDSGSVRFRASEGLSGNKILLPRLDGAVKF